MLAFVLLSSSVSAATDLAVSLTPPSVLRVYQAGSFNVRVRNLGNKHAYDVSLTIQLPRTATSPTVSVMGTLGAFSSRCTRVTTTLVCSLGTVNRNRSDSVFFEIALPYSTAPIAIDATASTSSTEPNTGNNSLHYVANPLTYNVTMATPATAVNRHCTGQPSLSSYFECTLFPSSISSHSTTFNAGGTITFVDAPATFTGTWTHTPANRLQFQYYDSGQLVAEFDGKGVSAKCFEGRTTFPQSPTYVSMYQVCLP